MTIAAQLRAIQERIAAACTRAGRASDAVALLAVSKGQPASAVREAFEAGQTSFGENYAQELVQKARELADLPIAWHFIGGLQRNKAKDVVPIAHTIQTVDRIALADALDQRATGRLQVLLEVNVSGESQKSGVAPGEVVALAEHCRASTHLSVAGLMTVPEAVDDPEATRPAFVALRRLRDDLVERGLSGSTLSMGMSHDFEIAIGEGATLVRVGTAIFGPRGAR